MTEELAAMKAAHDELLSELETDIDVAKDFEWRGWERTLVALRAIVKRHNPIGLFCEGCIQSGYEWPCPTIKDIEEAVKL